MKYFVTAYFVLLAGASFAQEISAKEGNMMVHRALLTHGSTVDATLKVSSDSIFQAWVRYHHPDWELTPYGNSLIHVKGRSTEFIRELIRSGQILYADQGNRSAEPEAVPGDFDNTLNTIPAAHATFFAFDGGTVRLSVKEKPFDVNDIDIRGRIDLTGPFDESPTNHATYMATIAAGGGNTNPLSKGAGWASTITTSDYERLLPDPDTELSGRNISVQNHSYGVGVENYYGIEAAEYDRQVMDLQTITHIFSAGNKGDQTTVTGPYAGVPGVANLTGQFKVSKNTICVGAAGSDGFPVPLSSKGPAHDGRIKPELIAIGDAGSSEAAAVVSGIALLVQDAWKKIHGELPATSMVKAILVNTAVDIGTPGPDFKSGFGYANALDAVATVKEGEHREGSVQSGETVPFMLRIPAGTAQLKVTLAWTDPPALPFAQQALVNDLDLTLKRLSDGMVWMPWTPDPSPTSVSPDGQAVRMPDHINNVEQISIDLPPPGDYEIRVNGNAVPQGPQPFAIAFSMRSGTTWTWPVKGSTAISGRTKHLRWIHNGSGSTGKLEYRYMPDGEWKLIPGEIQPDQNGFTWSLPDTVAVIRFRLTVNDIPFESQDLHLVPEQRIRVGFNCSDSTMLSWKKVATAERYLLEKLGDKYLEPFVSTTDTFKVLVRTEAFPTHFSVRPVIGGVPVIESGSIDIRKQGTDCYVIGFYAEKYLFDGPAVFQLKLGTTYGLSAIRLERKTGASWTTIEVVNRPAYPTLMLRDPVPLQGYQYYRAVLVRNGGGTVATEVVEILGSPLNEPFIFPNPVELGQQVNIISKTEESVVLQIYDQHGRIITVVKAEGPVKSVDTTGLPQGYYFLKVLTAHGSIHTAPLILK